MHADHLCRSCIAPQLLNVVVDLSDPGNILTTERYLRNYINYEIPRFPGERSLLTRGEDKAYSGPYYSDKLLCEFSLV